VPPLVSQPISVGLGPDGCAAKVTCEFREFCSSPFTSTLSIGSPRNHFGGVVRVCRCACLADAGGYVPFLYTQAYSLIDLAHNIQNAYLAHCFNGQLFVPGGV
jgi:hypothetical protein